MTGTALVIGVVLTAPARLNPAADDPATCAVTYLPTSADVVV